MDQGIVLLVAWCEMAVVVGVLAYLMLRRPR